MLNNNVSVPALEARGLGVCLGGKKIVWDINLKLASGEIACLLGRSGLGKTTVLRALAGLIQPSAGEVFLGGKKVTGSSGKMSYMFQSDLLLEHKRVLDNLILPLQIQGLKKQEARHKALLELDRFGLAGTEALWPRQLSGGMRQRVALLRTYLMGNATVLLDEPFSALDALTRDELRCWFKQMVRELGLSALMITHDIDEALLLAQKIYVLKRPKTAVELGARTGDRVARSAGLGARTSEAAPSSEQPSANAKQNPAEQDLAASIGFELLIPENKPDTSPRERFDLSAAYLSYKKELLDQLV